MTEKDYSVETKLGFTKIKNDILYSSNIPTSTQVLSHKYYNKPQH